MARYRICENCKEFVEYTAEERYEGGTSYTVLKCPKCGHIKKTTVSHIHYGDDGKL